MDTQATPALRGQVTTLRVARPSMILPSKCKTSAILRRSGVLRSDGSRGRAIRENRGNQKMEIQFFPPENNSMSRSYGKKLGHSVGNYKNVKTGG